MYCEMPLKQTPQQQAQVQSRLTVLLAPLQQ
jgi:hypothetical protein